MKKNTLLIFLFFTFYLPCQAREKKHEVSIGAGAASTCVIVNEFSNIMIYALTATLVSKNSQYSGTFHAGYKYLLNDFLSFGATYAYTQEKADAYSAKKKYGQFKNHYHTFAGEVDIKYSNRKTFNLYSSAGIAGTVYNQKLTNNNGESASDSMVLFDFQVSLLGIRLGNQWGAFAELGFGYKGIINGGVFVRF